LPTASAWPRATGCFLHITLSPSFLAQQLAEHFPGFAGAEFKRACRSNLALHRLARTHAAAIDHGLSGGQLYFEQLRAAMLNRLLLAFTTLAGHPAKIEKESQPPPSGCTAWSILSRKTWRRTCGYVMQRRLLRALGLLRRKQPVGEVARLCGFADHAHLTRLFKHSFGLLPSNVAAGDSVTAPSHQSALPAFSIRHY